MERRAPANSWLPCRISTETSADIITMNRRGGVAGNGEQRPRVGAESFGGPKHILSVNKSLRMGC
jgi:hypothetical protein